MILGIETATSALSVALVEKGGILRSMRHDATNAHDELLAPLCRDILQEHGSTAGDLTGIAVSAGPGSFTGLRIGLAVAKGMALALDIPLALVPTLDSLAFAASRAVSVEMHEELLVLLPSRKNEMYAAAYEFARNSWTTRSPVSVLHTEEIEAAIKKCAYIAGYASADILDVAQREHVTPLENITADATYIALLGEEMLSRGEAADTDTCEPLYVQQFEVKQAKHTLFRRKETDGD
ncbi:MAG: tRNA (adenosine(37)-N6)-threonylcarbamoyltransferase complex dimerization subunit type 1 TsaB [Ignavibacteria bacterium]|nr:MAG: tRNA (adenosine(37)-N6)-threonylcarbamoyltransferase complex dimerization subunit type 1 TsaB [Ignavibacteria bacterium]